MGNSMPTTYNPNSCGGYGNETATTQAPQQRPHTSTLGGRSQKSKKNDSNGPENSRVLFLLYLIHRTWNIMVETVDPKSKRFVLFCRRVNFARLVEMDCECVCVCVCACGFLANRRNLEIERNQMRWDERKSINSIHMQIWNHCAASRPPYDVSFIYSLFIVFYYFFDYVDAIVRLHAWDFRFGFIFFIIVIIIVLSSYIFSGLISN